MSSRFLGCPVAGSGPAPFRSDPPMGRNTACPHLRVGVVVGDSGGVILRNHANDTPLWDKFQYPVISVLSGKRCISGAPAGPGGCGSTSIRLRGKARSDGETQPPPCVVRFFSRAATHRHPSDDGRASDCFDRPHGFPKMEVQRPLERQRRISASGAVDSRPDKRRCLGLRASGSRDSAGAEAAGAEPRQWRAFVHR